MFSIFNLSYHLNYLNREQLYGELLCDVFETLSELVQDAIKLANNCNELVKRINFDPWDEEQLNDLEIGKIICKILF